MPKVKLDISKDIKRNHENFLKVTNVKSEVRYFKGYQKKS